MYVCMNSSVNTVVSSLRVRRSLTIFTRPVGMACQALMQSSVNFVRFNGIRVFFISFTTLSPSHTCSSHSLDREREREREMRY